MKNGKKLIAMILAGAMAFSLVGCRGSEEKDVSSANNGGKPVEISYWNSGIGLELLEKIVEQFNKKQSDWYVYYKDTASGDAAVATYGLADIDTVDLYMGGKPSSTSNMIPLDDLLEETADGDKKPLKDKFLPSYLEQERAADGHIYTLTKGGGAVSLVYNKKLFDKAGIKTIPRTTDELVVASDKLLQAGITPTTHFKGSGYWVFIYPLWQAQYDGIDYYTNNFYGCTDMNGKSPSLDVFTAKDGRYQVLKVLEKLITPEYVMNGSNSQDHITAQTMFLTSDIGYIVSGTWMSNEMKSVGGMEDFGIMRTPILSSITDKLTTVKKDADLRKLVSAIDEVLDGKAEASKYQSGENYVVDGLTVSAADWKRVEEARSMIASNYAGEVAFIPKYSDAQEGALEFLKYFYSDEGYKTYMDTTHIALPLNLSDEHIDMGDWLPFEKDINTIFLNSKYNISNFVMTKHDIFTYGGAVPYAGLNLMPFFCSNNPADRQTANELWENMVGIFESRYPSWTANIGL